MMLISRKDVLAACVLSKPLSPPSSWILTQVQTPPPAQHPALPAPAPIQEDSQAATTPRTLQLPWLAVVSACILLVGIVLAVVMLTPAVARLLRASGARTGRSAPHPHSFHQAYFDAPCREFVKASTYVFRVNSYLHSTMQNGRPTSR